MNVFVVGRTHLGNVIAECLNYAENMVWQWDEGDDALGACDAVHADVLFIAIDTPLVGDTPDVEAVLRRSHLPLIHAHPGAIVLVCSQVPVGTADRIAEKFTTLNVVSYPENIRQETGNGRADFMSQTRAVLGCDQDMKQHLRRRVEDLLRPFTGEFLWMTRRSAEMVKHALNAFLATQIAVANELGELCLDIGAHYPDVVKALKSDPRIGQRGYVNYGGGPGPNLMREINFLHHKAGGLFSAVKASHENFKPRGVA